MSRPGQQPFAGLPPEPVGDPVYVPMPYPAGAVPGYGPLSGQPRPAGAGTAGRGTGGLRPALGWSLFAFGIAIAVSALLPWAFVFGVSIDGTAGDGTVTAACALVVAGAGFVIGVGVGRMWAALTALAACALVTSVAIVDVGDVQRFVSPVATVDLPDSAVSTGPGLWLALAAGIAGTAAALAALATTGPGRR